MVFGNLAVLAAPALVPELLPDRSLEEALAPFAADGAVVAPRRSVAADDAELDGQTERTGAVPVLVVAQHDALFPFHTICTARFAVQALVHTTDIGAVVYFRWRLTNDRGVAARLSRGARIINFEGGRWRGTELFTLTFH